MSFHRLSTTDCSVVGLLPHHRKAQCFLFASHSFHNKLLTVRGQAEAAGNTESISTDQLSDEEDPARNGLKSIGDLRDLFRRADINK